MNDFDKIFSEKLYNHKTPPPANGWDQLNAALAKEQHAKRKVIFWRVAAAVLLLLIGGSGWWIGSQHQEATQLADDKRVETKVPEVVDNEFSAKEDTNQLALEEKQYANPSAGNNVQSTENYNNTPDNTSVKSPEKQSKAEVNKQEPQVEQQTQPMLASTEEEQMNNSAGEPNVEQIQSVETLTVEPLAPLEKELLAMEPIKTELSTPVTIIYKPGAAPNEEEKNIALELLSELKNTNITFSDIRNAKAELLAKVFSKKENEVTP